MQEQTATGPNGEKVVLRGGQWVPMDAQPQGQQFPGVIQGNPRSLTPDQEQQMRLRENEEARKQATFEGTGGKPAEGDKKAASFLIRALGANSGFEDTGLGGRSIFTQAFDDVAPDLSNTLVNSSDRQVADAAQREFIAAVLRLDSGAAIPPAEEDSYKRLYFPEPGDSEDVVKFKKQARQRAIEGLRLGAGPLADDAMARFESLQEQYKTDGLQEGASLEEDDAQPPPVTLGNSQGADGYGDDGNGNPLVLKDGQALLGYLDSGAPQYGPPDQNENIDPRAAKLLGIVEKRNRLLGEGGATDVLKSGNTLGLTDEASGVGEAIGAAIKGDFDVVNNYQLGRDAEQMRIDVGRAHLGPGLSLATEALGGGASLLNKPGQVIRAGRAAAQAGNLTKQGVRQQLTRQARNDGVIVGGVGGFGYGEGLEGSTSNALIGGITGGTVGHLGQKAGNALAARSEASGFNPARARQVAQAGEAEGVTVNRAMIDPNSNNAVTKADASLIGGRQVQREMQSIEGQFEGAVERLGGGKQPLDRTAVGDRVQRAGERFIKESREVTSKKYAQAEKLAGDTKIRPARASAALDEMLAKLKETPEVNSAEIKFLEGMKKDLSSGDSITVFRGVGGDSGGGRYYSLDREFARNFTRSGRDSEILTASIKSSDVYQPSTLPRAVSETEMNTAIAAAKQAGKKAILVDEGAGEPNSIFLIDKGAANPTGQGDATGGLSISALRDLRTSLSKKISKGDLVFGQNEARVLQIMDEAAQDISTGLRQQGKNAAAAAFDAADTAYASRMRFIDETVQKLIGKRGVNLSAEQVASKIESFARNDAEGLRKFWTILNREERADLQATFANALGRNNKGEFSPAIFLNNIGGKNRLMSERAIRTVFGRGGAESVENLRLIAREVNRVTSAMNSGTSKSGVASYRDFLWSALAGIGGFAQGGTTAAAAAVGVAGATAGKQLITARALMSPKIQKWLLSAPKTTNPKAIDAHFARLGNIAKAEPALANEIEQIRRGIMNAANDNVGVAAAAEEPSQ